MQPIENREIEGSLPFPEPTPISKEEFEKLPRFCNLIIIYKLGFAIWNF